MILDLNLLKKAITSLERALIKYTEDPKDEFISDSCIQRFEYTYELSYNLDMTLPNPEEADELSFPDLIRTGNTMSTYDEYKVKDILKILPNFLQEAQFLYQKLLDTN